jgi:hypothetical protein
VRIIRQYALQINDYEKIDMKLLLLPQRFLRVRRCHCSFLMWNETRFVGRAADSKEVSLSAVTSDATIREVPLTDLEASVWQPPRP